MIFQSASNQNVKKSKILRSSVAGWIAIVCLLFLAFPAVAGSVNTYQVTGPVLALTNDMIAVQKGKDRWELGRDASTKVDGDLKVGSKVTIQYRMVAISVTVKPEKSTKKAK